MEIMESIKRVNKTQAVKKCAIDTKKVVNTLLAELTDFVETQAELWDRGWYEVKEITGLKDFPKVKAKVVAEYAMPYNRNKRVTYDVEIRWDGGKDFTYKVHQASATVYYAIGGLEYHEEINGLN